MLEKVQRTIEKYNMFQAGDKVVVAVSGGPDSLALLYILAELKGNWSLELYVAHYNHLLRQEAADEANFVRGCAEELGLPVYVGEGDVAQYAKEQKLSTQVAARELRYAFLEDIVEQTGSQKLALAHQLEDQAETIVMHFLRGPSPKGLAGIPPVREKIVRPLIESSRKEIEEYLNLKKLVPVIDTSNYETVYLRNRIRLELMPILKEYNPNLDTRLLKGADLFRDEDDYLEEETARQWAKLCSWEQGRLLINYNGYRQLPPALKRRLLRRCFLELAERKQELSFEQVDRIYSWLETPVRGKKLEWPLGIWLMFIGKNIIVSRKVLRGQETDYSYVLTQPGIKSLPEGRLKVELLSKECITESSLKTDNQWQVLVDGDQVKFPLTIRNRRPGDRFYPLGLGGSKKLKDFFIDLKVPRHLRNRIAVVVSADGKIIWVVGFRLDERFKVTEATKKVICLSYIKGIIGDEMV
ncbi:MAG: tRNA lysidine(34) synthetase TilS [Clostridia bacterium]|nr:tRNA lysidine(34) synthetase TilS [Clostridia bacterium]